MTRPSDWDAVFGISDPTPGDPWSIRSMQRSWSELADDAERAESKLRQLLGDEAISGWIGEGGNAFRDKTYDLPDQLGKCHRSYRLAADALLTWASRLETHQGDADRALVQGRAAKADLDAASSSVTSASGSDVLAFLERYADTPPPASVTPPSEEAIRTARARLSSAQSAQHGAQSRLDAARQLALDAGSLREEDGRTAARAVREASDAGIPERSRWEKFKDWAADAWDIIVEICKIVVLVLGVVALIIGGPLAWVVFAAALLVLADTIMKYLKGEASLWDVALAALACIPCTKGLTTLSELSAAFRAGGMLGAGAHLLAAGKAAVLEMARAVRAAGPGLMTAIRGLGNGLLDLRRFTTWTGEGLSVAGEDLRVLNSFAAEAMRSEPSISGSLRSIVDGLPTSELEGFSARLKGFDSLARKTATDMGEDLGAANALADINDSIRYTVMTPGDDFAGAANHVADSLSGQGFENVSFKNTFGSSDYQGINTNWRDPATGRSFEVQFHTPESFAAKTETHILYEEQRLPGTSPERVAELKALQAEIFGTVPTPSGATSVGLPSGTHLAGPSGVYIPPAGVGDYGRKPFQLVGYTYDGATVGN